MSKVERQVPGLRVPEWLQNELLRKAGKGIQVGITKGHDAGLPRVSFPSCLPKMRVLHLDALSCRNQRSSLV